MEDAARRLLETIAYRGAGTVEFLWDEARQRFRFLEVNARIQVEHPVTEERHGLDLVAWQVAFAFGRLEAPRVPEPKGHAVEVRILAEDMAFRPSPGTITRWDPPGDVRVDSGYAAGATVPPFYDSLLAKLVVHAESRAEAVARLARALETFQVDGIATSLPFLRRIVAHPDFVANRLSTRWLETAFAPRAPAAA
jgi:acetyl-CoA carboxylase biotin carboxylase subunit